MKKILALCFFWNILSRNLLWIWVDIISDNISRTFMNPCIKIKRRIFDVWFRIIYVLLCACKNVNAVQLKQYILQIFVIKLKLLIYSSKHLWCWKFYKKYQLIGIFCKNNCHIFIYINYKKNKNEKTYYFYCVRLFKFYILC